jgi:hypothetical protein
MSYSPTEGQLEPVGTWDLEDPLENDLGDDFDPEDLYEDDGDTDYDAFDPTDDS